MGEERIRELCERVVVQKERINVREWRICEVDGGGKVSQICEIIKERGRKGVEIVFTEGERNDWRDIGNGVRLEWRIDREERPVNKTGLRELR